MKILGQSPKNGTLSVLFTYIYIYIYIYILFWYICVIRHAWVSPILEFWTKLIIKKKKKNENN